MIYAKNQIGERIEPMPGANARCPACDEEVIAKCGYVNRWHWSHLGDTDCDQWSEHETPWHLSWKDYFAPSEREVVMGPHRADICTKAGRVIELQHSAISPEEILERESFYGSGMVWVLDASEFIKNIEFRDRGEYHSFRWKWPRKTWAVAKRPVFLDPGDGDGCWDEEVGDLRECLFHLRKMSDEVPCGGWGRWGCKWDFLRFFSVEFTARERESEHRMNAYCATVRGGQYATR